MPFLVVLISLAAFFVPGFLVGSIAKWLVFGETAHANRNGFFLWRDLERSLSGFKHFAHSLMFKIE
jgi:hypothetical protein